MGRGGLRGGGVCGEGGRKENVFKNFTAKHLNTYVAHCISYLTRRI